MGAREPHCLRRGSHGPPFLFLFPCPTDASGKASDGGGDAGEGGCVSVNETVILSETVSGTKNVGGTGTGTEAETRIETENETAHGDSVRAHDRESASDDFGSLGGAHRYAGPSAQGHSSIDQVLV